MKKYFFFDIDGTLAFGRTKQVSDETKRCIRLLREKGHFVSIATGRLQLDAYAFAKNLGIHTLVSDGGNSVTMEGEIIKMESLPVQEIIEFLNELDQERRLWATTIKNELLRYTKSYDFITEINDSYYETKVDPFFDPERQTSFFKVFVHCPLGKENEIDFKALPHVRFSKDCIFIEPKNKSVGIKKIIQLIQGDESEVVVFGDGMNDLEMFRPEWFSVAMGNSVEKLKEKADYITLNCEEEGIMAACRKFGWI